MSESVPKTRPVFLNVPLTHYSKADTERRVVAGYASFDVIDRQNEKITHEAMREALKQFMSEPEFANTHVMHGNCAVGKVIKSYTDKNGEIWETKVDDTGTFIVSELRTDIKRAVQTWELIERGVLKSYSIGGLALNPKELVCDNGSCHWEIDKLEIHEFSYVDRPAVKGADFIIVKREAGMTDGSEIYSVTDDGYEVIDGEMRIRAMSPPSIASMSNPSEPLVLTMNEENNVNKEQTPNPDTIIMPEPQAEPIIPETVEPEAKAEKAAPKKAAPKKAVKKETKPKPATSPESEATEKADATPILLEIKGMLEKITAALAQKPEPTEPKKFDYPAMSRKFEYPTEKVDALELQYGEEKSFHLLELIGDEAFKLLIVAKDEEEEKAEEPKEELAPEPEAEPEKTEEVPAEEPVEPVAEPTEKMIPETPDITIEQMVEAQVEATIAKLQRGQKRSPVPVIGETPARTLMAMYNMEWSDVEALASRGA